MATHALLRASRSGFSRASGETAKEGPFTFAPTKPEGPNEPKHATMHKPSTSLFSAAALALLAAGCATVDPRTVPQTVYDQSSPYAFSEEDKPLLKKTLKSKRRTISVQVDTSPVSSESVDMASVGVNLHAELQSALDSVEFLRTVSANDELMAFVNAGYGGDGVASPDLPDYILLCRLTFLSVANDNAAPATLGGLSAALGLTTAAAAAEGKDTTTALSGSGTAMAGGAALLVAPQRVNVKAYFEIYDREEGQTRFSKILAKEERGVAGSGVENAVQRLLAGAAAEYMEQVMYKIGPIGLVMKTSGNGRYAYISLGQEAGLASDGCVQFLRKEDATFEEYDLTSFSSDETEDGNEEEVSAPKKKGKGKAATAKKAPTRLPLESVADGHVVQNVLPEPNRAWVEVDNFDEERPLVKRGMLVRLVPVSRKEGFMARFGL